MLLELLIGVHYDYLFMLSFAFSSVSPLGLSWQKALWLAFYQGCVSFL